MIKRVYLIALLLTGCANNWLNLKQSEFVTDEATNQQLHRKKTELPLGTYYGPLGDDAISAYSEAVRIINNKAGCEIFKQPKHVINIPSGMVEVRCWNRIVDYDMTGEEEDITTGLCISQLNQEDTSIHHSTLFIPCFRPFREEQVRTAVHELLHALGFDHDRELGTIMYVNNKFNGDEFQETDLYILRNYYCGSKTFEEVSNIK